MGLRRRAFEWYVRRWLSQARRGKKGEGVKKLLDLALRNKAKLGWIAGGIAGGLKGLGYEGAGDTVLLLAGLLLGGGYMASDKEAKAKQ